MTEKIATTEVEISASPAKVWAALTEPEQIREYLFGAEVNTTWKPGTQVVWRGQYDDERFEDRGNVLEFEPEQRLSFTHYSPHSGKDDRPENYVQITLTLHDEGERTRVTLEQDNNPDDRAVLHAKHNWGEVLEHLKRHVERR